MAEAAGVGEPSGADRPSPHPGSIAKLTLGAIGVVFGDIGTSPIYAFRETFAGHHPLPVDRPHVLGVLSLIFWSMMIVVTLKYVAILMRADNRGEGGSLALLALISRSRAGRRSTRGLVLLGLFACALFYGDSMITPAVSVLSAVEGLTLVESSLTPLVLPIAVAILVGLFVIQRRGTATVGALFGPVIGVYFATLAVLGLVSLWSDPGVLRSLNPWHAAAFFVGDPLRAFLALGSVVLAVTGAEALYADMGHFGMRPIRTGWLAIVLPALMLNYLGQGALLAHSPEAIESPFYLLAPEWFRLPLVLVATLATVIASQAVISGAFSVTQQAMQLGYIPRMAIRHTSAQAASQIYIPAINWALMAMVILLVLVFRTSSNLTSAYGIAVTGAMAIDTCLLAVVLFKLWRWNRLLAGSLVALFAVVDGAYFAANLTKVPDGGWFPLLIGLVVFVLLTTWGTGRRLMAAQLDAGTMPVDLFVRSAHQHAARVKGTAVFMTATREGVPPALLHNMKHNKVLHERVAILNVHVEEVPYIEDGARLHVQQLAPDFYRITLAYGFMQEMDVPADLARITACGPRFDMADTSFFLGRQTLIASDAPGMAIWRENLFAWMQRNAESAMSFFKLPPNRVVELGSQVEI